MKTSIILVIAALLSACATPDSRFGEAVRNAKVAMTMNPNGSVQRDGAAGIDGQAAAEGLRRYHDSFKAPPPVVNVINIGGALGAGK